MTTTAFNSYQCHRLSWEVYVKQIFVTTIVAWILAGLMSWFELAIFRYILMALLVLWLFWGAVQILENFKFRIYTNEQGVWIDSGIFPWNKGIYGLNWRDISGATYQIGFVSWVLRSYRINVQHRYTKDSEILLSNIRHGDKLAIHINDLVQRLDLY